MAPHITKILTLKNVIAHVLSNEPTPIIICGSHAANMTAKSLCKRVNRNMAYMYRIYMSQLFWLLYEHGEHRLIVIDE